MDDSRRSSKRRKVDNPGRNPSSPLAEKPAQRASGRLATRNMSLGPGNVLEEGASPLRKTRASNSNLNTPSKTANGISRKRVQGERQDVYDDIDGALGIEPPAPKSVGTPRKTPRKKAVLDPSLPNPFKKTPKADAASKGDKVDGSQKYVTTPKFSKTSTSLKGGGASGRSFRSFVNGYKHGNNSEEDVQDELAADVTTPSGRKRGTRVASGLANGSPAAQNATPLRSVCRSSRRIAEVAEEREESEVLRVNGVNGATPSKSQTSRRAVNRKGPKAAVVEIEDESSIRTPSESSRQRGTDQYFEDELGDRSPPSRTRSARARRKSNRVDHISNREEVFAISEDESAEDAPSEVNDHGEDHMDVDGGSILDPTEPSPLNPIPAQKEKEAQQLIHGDMTQGRELDLLKSIVIERITAKRAAPLVGLDKQYRTVHQLVQHTITAGEGNSMLLIGARGSGKTALVNKVLSEATKDNSEDFHTVRLNGFIHTDDKIALREIWRQLGKEMEIEDDGSIGKNYGDTLQTLLALLSHPSEHTGVWTEEVTKAIVFVMDEFDLFAYHPRQTLLYNLFDIAQSRKAPIAILGLTTRIDVVNMLEKRVKSRFSQRYVHLSLARTFTAFQERCKASLLVEPGQLSVEERVILCSTLETTPRKKSKKCPKDQDIISGWNENISSLFTSKSFLTTHLAPHYYRTKSIPAVLTSFLIPTSTLISSLHPPDLATSLAPPDSKLHILPTLSTLALSLLIAAARLDIIHDSDTCNFNMAYDEYVTIASKARIQSAAGGATASGSATKVWGKEVARREWEDLVELGFIIPVSGGGNGGFGMVKVDIALEEIGALIAGEKGVEKVLERWCKQL